MENEIVIITEEEIRNKMYLIRGMEVMLDSDLAKIYGYTTKAFNQQVKNNIERFDDDFMFQLNKEEYYKILRSKNMTLELKQGKYSKYLPYVYTEQGIYMLMTILKGKKAVLQSKALVRIFKHMKDFIINNNLIEQKYINDLVLKHDNKIIEYDSKFEEIFTKFDLNDYLKNKLLFKNHISDAYSFLLNILKKDKKEIIIFLFI